MPKETKKRLKQRKQNSIIAIIVLSLIFVAATTTLIVAFVEWHNDKELKAEFKNRQEQTVQAEVASKRIIKDSFYGKHSSIDIYIYVISFKFPDDSIKELQVDRQSYRWPPKNDPDSVQYDSLTVGDIGILTYKEIENIEERVKNENVRYGSRLFISFEKDPQYGRIENSSSGRKRRDSVGCDTGFGFYCCFILFDYTGDENVHKAASTTKATKIKFRRQSEKDAVSGVEKDCRTWNS